MTLPLSGENGRFSTGSPALDALFEEVRAGDNVVFYSNGVQDYRPFVRSAVRFALGEGIPLIYVRASGSLDDLLLAHEGISVWEVAHLAEEGPIVQAFVRRAVEAPSLAYYIFEPLIALAPWLPDEAEIVRAFETWCPLLYERRSVAYWELTRGYFEKNTIAAIRDCTQIFIRLEHDAHGLTLMPLKVWGRYAERMFQPHRVEVVDGEIRIVPIPPGAEGYEEYVRALADKNRELAEIRDALHAVNATLRRRNEELAALNARFQEQSRLYESLRNNLESLLALFRVSREIGSSLVIEQVYEAILAAAMRLFDVEASALHLRSFGECPPVEMLRGEMPMEGMEEALAPMRREALERREVLSLEWPREAALPASAAIAPIILRGECPGTVEVYAPDGRLHNEGSRTLLGYLASEASIALDNAHLYRESDRQKAQLRSFVDSFILKVEQESRQLALDLHDGLVQLIVASFQHLQTAQAWRGRDPAVEEKELARGTQILQQAIYEARRLIGQLRPAGLDDFGLAHALRTFVSQLAAEEGWRITLEIDPRWKPLPPTLEAGLFRIVQEATNNARKYAEADRLHIALRVEGEHLVLSVRDWGKGFDPVSVAAEPEKGLHIGLVGIRERALLFGGECLIKSAPGQGTTITVRLPRPKIAAPEAR